LFIVPHRVLPVNVEIEKSFNNRSDTSLCAPGAGIIFNFNPTQYSTSTLRSDLVLLLVVLEQAAAITYRAQTFRVSAEISTRIDL
jgi:hypothetical protein